MHCLHMSRPGLEAGAKDAKAELRTLLLADHGLELYGNGIVATEETLASNPDLVKRFVRAGLRGWKFALANPEKAAEDQIKYVPTLKAEVSVQEIDRRRPRGNRFRQEERPGLVRSGQDGRQCRVRGEVDRVVRAGSGACRYLRAGFSAGDSRVALTDS